MPHCVIEFSDNLLSPNPNTVPDTNHGTSVVTPDAMMKTVHQAALDSNLFDPSTIKTRAASYQHMLGSAERFVHVTVKILSGRTTEQKAALSNLVLERLQALPFPAVELSVDVVDMQQATYSKGKAGV